MKKWTCLLMAMMIFAAVCFNGCGIREEEASKAPTNVPTEVHAETQEPTSEPAFHMPVYTEEEIQAAKDVVAAKFNEDFYGCDLQRLEYIEGKYLSDYEYYAQRSGIDRVLILESDFYAGPDAHGSFNLDHLYDNWKWILIDDGSGWVIRTYGYG